MNANNKYGQLNAIYNLSGHENTDYKTCFVCGKKFPVYNLYEYCYKKLLTIGMKKMIENNKEKYKDSINGDDSSGTWVFFCSWHCLREAERDEEFDKLNGGHMRVCKLCLEKYVVPPEGTIDKSEDYCPKCMKELREEKSFKQAEAYRQHKRHKMVLKEDELVPNASKTNSK